MFHFPDSDTGYYDREETFYAHDAEMEAAEERRYLEEIEASHDGGEREMDHTTRYSPLFACPDYRQIAVDLARNLASPTDDLDPETGCTAAEMNEDRAPAYPMEREINGTAETITVRSEGKVA